MSFNPIPSSIKKKLAAFQQHGVIPSSTAIQSGIGTAHLPTPPKPTAPAAPPTSQTLPFDPIYEQTVSNNNQTRDNTLGSIEYQRGRDLTDAGYVQGADGGFTLDPSNPFSKAALLQRHYDQSQAASKNGLAAQGQLYSGALQNAQNENRFQFDQGSNANLLSLQDALQGLADRRTGAISDAAAANTGALGDSISRAIANAQAARPDDAAAAANAAAAPAPKPPFKVTKDSKGRTVHVYPDGRRVTLK